MVEHKLGVSIVGEDKASGPIRNVQSALVNLDKSAKTSAGGFNTLGAAAATAAGFIVAEIGGKAVSAVSDLAKEMVKLGLEQDRLATRSKNLYKNLGLEKYQKEIAKTIEQQSIMTGMDDEELLSSYNKLLAVTKDRTQATKLLALAQDMAAGSGENLESSTTSITNALMGQTRGLKQFGIDIEEDTFKATTFAGQIRMLEQEINKLYAGAAGEAGKSPAGIFAGFETAIENVKEMFGGELIESLAPSLKSITDTINELATSGKLDPLIESFGNLVTSGVKLAETVSKILMDFMGFQNSQQAVEWLTTTFERVAVAIDLMATSLKRIRDIIAGLDLSRLQPLVNLFAGASNPGGLLGLITGDEALNNRIAKKNKPNDDFTVVVDENTKATTRATFVVDSYTESTRSAAKGNSILESAAISAADSLKSIFGSSGKGSSGSGGCRTFGTTVTVNAGGQEPLSNNVPNSGGRFDLFTATNQIFVPDALITKKGDIVRFHPDDNILAYQDPSSLRGGTGGNVSVVINVNGSGDPDRVAELIMKKIEKIQRMS